MLARSLALHHEAEAEEPCLAFVNQQISPTRRRDSSSPSSWDRWDILLSAVLVQILAGVGL